jgi:hypothetical protein
MAESVASVRVPKLLSAGEVVTTGQTSRNSTTASSQTTSTTTRLDLLGGHIVADGVKSESTSSDGTTGFAVSPAGTTFTHLVIDGKPIAANVAPNTRISLGQLGTLTLNEQVRNVGPTSGSLVVRGLDLQLNENDTEVIVSEAQSSLQTVPTGQLGGLAYGSVLYSPAGVVSGPTAFVWMPCAGTMGAVKTNTVAGVTIPKALTTGTVTDTAQGTVSPAAAQGETTATTQKVDLLGGQVTASAVKADSHASLQGSTSSSSAAGSKFVGLQVAGHPEIHDSVAPNTSVNIPSVGTLRLNWRYPRPNGLEVVMIEAILAPGNKYGLPAGAVLAVSVVDATVHG